MHGRELHVCPFCGNKYARPTRKEVDGVLLNWMIQCGSCDFECNYEHWFKVVRLHETRSAEQYLINVGWIEELVRSEK